MKLNPEELEVVSFETDAVAAAAGSSILRPEVDTDPNNPTPNTYCFVCD
jgi:hypothetical protein